MTKRKKRKKIILAKFSKNNQITLKKFKEKISRDKKYEREPWMMRVNPPADLDEENVRKEAESF